jgi:uroporphyrin-III C-methyltransferase
MHGFEAIVVPGVSSALAGPTFSNVSLTQRGVAESFVVCTGVGRQGRAVSLPGYVRSRTTVLLMGVARLNCLIDTLVQKDLPDGKGRRDGAAYPAHLPIVIIERASMPDQRIIAGTLKGIQAAMESIGEQRPPGMIVIGWTVLALWSEGETTVLDEDESLDPETRDTQRIEKWLNGRSWRVQEGLSKEWAEFADALMQ